MSNKTLVTKTFMSTSYDPWYNLALEEYLLNQVKKGEVYLYLWQNQNTVVIGRNQNPWRECKCKQLEEQDGKLARRLSGGGAVYHDLGNLNFTFIMDKKIYDLQRQLDVIIQALKKLGIHAEFSGRNDILFHGKKFSGNAYYYRELVAYHHGTIMVDVDFSKLAGFLQVSKEKIESKGIKSVESRVVNLKEIQPELTLESLKEALLESFVEEYGGTGERIQLKDTEEVAKFQKKYSSWEWRYGETPKFDLTLSNRFPWGGVEIGLQLRNANVVSAKIFSDSLEPDIIEEVAKKLTNVKFDVRSMVDSIVSIETKSDKEAEILADLSEWIKVKSF